MRLFPQHTADVTVGDRTMRAEELHGAASAVAARVQGAPAIAVRAEASPETVVAVVGCLLAGVPVVPLAPDAGEKELAHVLRDSGAVPLPDVDLAARASFSAPEPGPSATATALILYTSGTTGLPKGVPVTRRAIAACLDGLAERWAWDADDVLVHGLPLYHVHGLVLGVLGPLRVGSRLIHTVRPQPLRYASARGTLYFGVPTVWSRIAADPAAATALRHARLLVSGSAGLPAGVARDLAALTGLVPVERYGMTETLITIAADARAPRRVGWVGTPITGVQARVVDAPADGETPGDLQVRGDTVFGGYLGRDASGFTGDGWFDTGDVAVTDADGWVKIVGRKSTDLIKSGGYRIGAGEVESALLDHPAVTEAAVIGAPDPDLGERVVAYVVAADPVPAQELIDFVARTLSVHKRPREIRFVGALPRNHMGKVQKTRLAG
ncbi:AMP-binding protein [Catenuloplanes japonicus]|uniref:AMP-binding protein n=1 Tax=Catenuloplanes japonicus TaxID=33876 RepID=UPI0005259CAE|nr:AMP-binding protein [Catenuloplanes japonicus]